LAGRSFQATAVARNGEALAIVKQTPISVAFGKPGRVIGWSGGCNAIGAKGARVGRDQIVVKGYISTAMGCPGPESQQEQWVNAFFESDPRWQLTGTDTLRLMSQDTVIDLHEIPTRRARISH
jgi:heat shock protein HslJ